MLCYVGSKGILSLNMIQLDTPPVKMQRLSTNLEESSIGGSMSINKSTMN